MSVDATTPEVTADHGHHTSLGVSNNKLAMWAFLGSECLFFGALIATYLIYLNARADAPGPEIFDIPFTSVSTFILLMSSLGMVLALAAIQRGDMRRFRVWMIATALMGATFIAGQMYEYTVFFAEGAILPASPLWSSFFLLTGFHGVHVTVGILMLVAAWVASMSGRLTPAHEETVENIGLYWHFVDIVWILLFTVVYLIPADLAAAG
ncbi:MAG: cytochrome oxidase subunit III [Nitriliruptorales bacterium]|nr:cytochrome oxidase subunit III [Nitriliruptorales bacterium]